MTATISSAFVPAQLDCSDFANLQPLYQTLQDRSVESVQQLTQWLQDLSALSAVVQEYGTRLYINKASHTEDKQIEQAYLHFVEHVEPKLQPVFFKLQQKFLTSSALGELEGSRYAMLIRQWRDEVEIYRDENVPLFTQATKLRTEYDKLRGAMMVEFNGQQLTLQQLGRYLEEPDRTMRERVWLLSEQRQAQDIQAMERLFDELLELRAKVAANAGMSDYRAYAWKMYGRHDYTPDACHAFADAVEKLCMPVVERLDEQRAKDLGVDRLKPWDMSVDPKNRPALRPFDPANISDFIERAKVLLHRVSPRLSEDFDTLRQHGNLDLDSRKGKRPGGFQSTLYASRQPFIFMNAAGVQRDVETLLHEAGHAFHMIWAKHEPLIFLMHAPMEFCEVASMSMELLGDEHLDVFYANDLDAQRAKRTHLENIIRLLPWIATIDQFQHWLYTNPGHTRQQRAEAWLSVLGRFSSKVVDWAGHEDVRRYRWHRQLHLYGAPFYYIEYGIAQLGALQLWRNAKRNPSGALANYRRALSLGGTLPLPELFLAADIRFDFTSRTIEPLMQLVRDELDKLPS